MKVFLLIIVLIFSSVTVKAKNNDNLKMIKQIKIEINFSDFINKDYCIFFASRINKKYPQNNWNNINYFASCVLEKDEKYKH